jgi:hypothetical protein
MKNLALLSIFCGFILSPALYADTKTDEMAKAMLAKQEKPEPRKKKPEEPKIPVPPKSHTAIKPVAKKAAASVAPAPHASPAPAPAHAAPHPESGKTGGW